MAWIESHTVLLRHPKLLRLARELRIKPVHCLGHLHALWHTTLETREDGDLSSWSDADIAAAAGFSGKAPPFVSSLRLSGWLDNALVHDWLDYAGLYLTRKYAKRNKERLAEIWAKHGRVYGSGERPSDNLATTQQQLLAPQEVGEVFSKDSLLSKDSSSLEGPPEKPGETDSAWLARLWLFHRRGGHSDHDRKSGDNFADLLKAGVSKDVIAAEIKSRGRAKANEPIWDFIKRLTPGKGKHGPTKNDGRTSQRFTGTATPL